MAKKPRKRLKGLCPRCFKVRLLYLHHIYPVRFYGCGKRNDAKLPLCSQCHAEIDKILEGKLKLTRTEYYLIHKRWMQGITPMIVKDGVCYG